MKSIMESYCSIRTQPRWQERRSLRDPRKKIIRPQGSCEIESQQQSCQKFHRKMCKCWMLSNNLIMFLIDHNNPSCSLRVLQHKSASKNRNILTQLHFSKIRPSKIIIGFTHACFKEFVLVLSDRLNTPAKYIKNPFLTKRGQDLLSNLPLHI